MERIAQCGMFKHHSIFNQLHSLYSYNLCHVLYNALLLKKYYQDSSKSSISEKKEDENKENVSSRCSQRGTNSSDRHFSWLPLAQKTCRERDPEALRSNTANVMESKHND